MNSDPINPSHYKTDSGVECIDIIGDVEFCVKNAIKYIWRAGKKGDELEQWGKAYWYILYAIDTLKKDFETSYVIEKEETKEKLNFLKEAFKYSDIGSQKYYLIKSLLQRIVAYSGDLKDISENLRTNILKLGGDPKDFEPR